MKYKIFLTGILIVFLYSGSITYTSDEIHKFPILNPLPELYDPVPVNVVSAAPETSAPEQQTKLLPGLKEICACESAGKKDREPVQFGPDGKVLKGIVHPADLGMCQINSAVHGAEAVKLGIDLTTTEGNITFANMLYSAQGSKPWDASKACWQ